MSLGDSAGKPPEKQKQKQMVLVMLVRTNHLEYGRAAIINYREGCPGKGTLQIHIQIEEAHTGAHEQMHVEWAIGSRSRKK